MDQGWGLKIYLPLMERRVRKYFFWLIIDVLAEFDYLCLSLADVLFPPPSSGNLVFRLTFPLLQTRPDTKTEACLTHGVGIFVLVVALKPQACLRRDRR